MLVFNFLMKYFGLNLNGAHTTFALFIIFLSFAAFFGVLWEFFEFVTNRYIVHINFITYTDTLSDLFFDLLGGVVGFLLIL